MKFFDSNNISFSDCVINGTEKSGIDLSASIDVAIKNVTIDHVRGYAISIKSSDSVSIIESVIKENKLCGTRLMNVKCVNFSSIPHQFRLACSINSETDK